MNNDILSGDNDTGRDVLTFTCVSLNVVKSMDKSVIYNNLSLVIFWGGPIGCITERFVVQ